MLNIVLCPGVKVSGAASPLMLKPAPLTLACEIVTLDPPEFVKLADCDWLLPTCTLPKLKLAGLATSCPGAIPVPERATVMAEMGSLAAVPLPCP